MVNNMAVRGRMKLQVHLDDNGRISEVFVSPTTKCRDIVLRLQRQIKQTNCCLVEVWQGCERLVPEDELIQSTLLEWDTDLEEVVFYLRPIEDRISPHLLDHVSDSIQIIEEEPPQISGSTLVVTRNGLHDNHGRLGYTLRGRLSVEELQQLALRQQQEIELKERQLTEKEQQLKEIKQRTRHKIRSTYIDQLETQIQEQDLKMRELRQMQDDIESYRLSNNALDEELQSMEAQFSIKEQELAIAAAKVEGLTKQLNEQREKWKNASKEKVKNMEEVEVDRLRQELMTRNELNHQQNVQMQAQKQLLAEKHKELFELDSQIEQLTQELHKKKSGNLHPPPHSHNSNYTNNHNTLSAENEFWGNGESFDWSEFANTKDTYDEEMLLNYNNSNKSDTGHRSRQNHLRHLETLLEEEEPPAGSGSKVSSLDGSSSSQVDPHSAEQVGKSSRVSRLATFFEAEVAAQNEPKDQKVSKQKVFGKALGDVDESKPTPVETSTAKPRGEHVSNSNSSLKLQTSEQEKVFDNVFYQRPITSSPLSSPSSLSSLSSLSSTSSASRAAARHDELRGSHPESALRNRETKTTGLETSSVSTSPYEETRVFYDARGYGDNSVENSPSNINNLDYGSERNTIKDPASPFENVKTSLQQFRSMAMSLNESGRTSTRKGNVLQYSQETSSQEHAIDQDTSLVEYDRQRSQQTVNFMVKPTGTLFVPQQQNSAETPARKTSSPSVAMVFASSPDISSRDDEDGKGKSRDEQIPHWRKVSTDDNNYSGKDSGAPFRNAFSNEELGQQKSNNTNVESCTASSQAVSKVRITLVSSGKKPTPTKFESSEHILSKERGVHTSGEVTSPFNAKASSPKGQSRSQNRIPAARVTAIDPQHTLEIAKNSDISEEIPQKVSPADKKKPRRVILDPHAVLLDAAVEGELEQVRRVIRNVDDPSLANSDGITALHNAVCGNHESVVRFLVEYGCDVNLPDSHGWTPLHCSAANNNINVIRYLVEHGACIFATTGLQKKIPIQCCEKSLAGYQESVDYLQDIQDNFGVAADGKVYALYTYNANEKDELSFECGEELHVLRRGDSNEKEWWWAENASGQTGYIPRNLLGIFPRMAPEV